MSELDPLRLCSAAIHHNRWRADGPGRRFSLSMFLVFALCLVTLIFTQRLTTSSNINLTIGRTIQSWSTNEVQLSNITVEIEEVLADQRAAVAHEMKDYKYPAGRYNVTAKSLKDLVPELGGQPLRSLVLTTWRSGSTFLGDVLNSHPANFYHYEPLLDYEIVQIRGPPTSIEVMDRLENLLRCNYSNLDHYLEYGQEHTWLFTHNVRLWDQCQLHPHLCWLPQFLSPFCSLFPFQSMKTVRLRLHLIQQFLADASLNVRVLLLVRDPRGTMQSRRHREWCPGQPDCWDPAKLCADLTADYATSVRLADQYPHTFRAMRYEDLSLDPYEGVQQLFQFFGLDFHPQVREFLDTHTKTDAGGVSSTFRNSKAAPFHWRQDLTFKEFLEMGFDTSQNLDIDVDAEMNGKVTEEMAKIISQLRNEIKKEIEGYKLPSLREVTSLIAERGGTPMRSMVVTTWRSGSTFVGGVLDSHPATFHFSEPLTDFRTVQVRGEPLAAPAVRALRSLLTCDYRVLGRYLQRSREYTWLSTHNTRLWAHCQHHRDICYEPQFLTPVCKLFPFQSMKVVHIRLRLVEELLADSSLNVRVVYLVRDPRGVMGSRASLGWCHKSPDCGSATHVCADLVDDYAAALRFTALYPDKFKVVRYEDMSLRPNEVIPDIFHFLRLQYHRDVQRFVKTHTTQVNKNRYSTYRNSSAQALLWRSQLSHAKVRQLQTTCRVAMTAWGYLPAHNASHQAAFNPLAESIDLA